MPRPTKKTSRLITRVLDAVAGGSNLTRIAAESWAPEQQTTYRWLREDEGFSDKYARAREARADWRADEIDRIWQGSLDGSLDVQAARVAIDALKWQAGKEAPRYYGDRVTHAGDKGAPVAIEMTWLEPKK